MKVLVADDDPDLRATVAEYLQLQGMETLEAANGLEALLHIKRSRPNAVVLDLRMPRLGGLDALKRIHAFDPSIAVVVVTAEVDETLHRQASNLGARAVLAKPVPFPTLLAALRGVPVPADPAPQQAAPIDTPPAAPSPRVLVIDDDDGIRELLVEFLTSRGYEVVAVARAAAGVAAIAQREPDVVLLDIEMPELSGADALPTIRALAPRAVVIMVSGTHDEAIAKRTLAFGAYDYIVKPLDFAYLAQSLESALTMRSLEL